MAFIFMSDGNVFQVPGLREGVVAGLAKAAQGRLWEIEAEGFKAGNPNMAISINPAQVVAVTDFPLTPSH
jgi:hypothetical protein